MIMVLALMSWWCFTGFVSWTENYIVISRGTFFNYQEPVIDLTIVVFVNIGYGAWCVGFWLLCFKYWQTSYELSSLFRIRCEKR